MVAENQWKYSLAICHKLQLLKHVCLILVDFFMPVCQTPDCGILIICMFVSYRWFMELLVGAHGYVTMCTYLKKVGVHNSGSFRQAQSWSC